MAGTIEFSGSSNSSDLSAQENKTWAPDGSINGGSVLDSPAKGNENSASMNDIPENFTDSFSQNGGGEIQFVGESNGRIAGASN